MLISGTAGTGKSTLAALFCDAACRRGERVLYFAFEEAEAQIMRNMGSVGMDLGHWVDEGLLQFRCVRPTLLGLEAHLAIMQRLVNEIDPSVVVVDPISDLRGDSEDEVSAMLTRQVGFLKGKGVTAIFTSLSSQRQGEASDQQIESLIDTWIVLKTVEANGERNRAVSVLKSRGMPHSNQIREFLITAHGIELADVCVGPEGVLTGSARAARTLSESAEASSLREELARRRVDLELRRQSVRAETAALWRQVEADAEVLNRLHGPGSVEEAPTAGAGGPAAGSGAQAGSPR